VVVRNDIKNFTTGGIDKLSFREYSTQYPHTQWTVGLAGRPSGPDFYINKIDNTIRHGPGGQMHTGDPKLDGSGWRAINKGEKWDENDKIVPL